jgi:hypothetical protein
MWMIGHAKIDNVLVTMMGYDIKLLGFRLTRCCVLLGYLDKILYLFHDEVTPTDFRSLW